MNLRNFKEGYVETPQGGAVYWAAYGNPDAAPVLLVHGGSGHVFDLEQMSAFSQDDHYIVTMHQRGMGRSAISAPDPNHNTTFSHVMDMETVRKHLDIEKWHLFSWSYGAIFMTAYGCLHPERCMSLSSYAPFLGEDEDWDIFFDQHPQQAQTYLEHYGADDIRAAKGEAFLRASSYSKERRLEDAFHMAGIFGNNGSAEAFRSSKTPDEWDAELQKSLYAEQLYDETMNILPQRWLFTLAHENSAFQSLPVTLFFGKQDAWVAPNTNIWFVYPYSRQVMIDGASHNVHETAVQQQISETISATAFRDTPAAPMPEN